MVCLTLYSQKVVFKACLKKSGSFMFCHIFKVHKELLAVKMAALEFLR